MIQQRCADKQADALRAEHRSTRASPSGVPLGPELADIRLRIDNIARRAFDEVSELEVKVGGVAAFEALMNEL